MYGLETSQLTHRYSQDGPSLQAVSLKVPLGAIYGFLGPNGAGKTTTLRLCLGLLQAQEGRIEVLGKDLTTARVEVLRQVGSLIESPSLYDHLTAVENLTLLQRIHRCPRQRIDEVLALVGLAHTGRKPTGRFSLGMRQRLSIAMALIHRPRLLILDEPTNGLDPHGIIEMRALLTRLNQVEGVTIVISSHLLAEVEKLASHVGILSRGRLVFQGTLDQLKEMQQQRLYFGTDDPVRAVQLLRDRQWMARIEGERVELPVLPTSEVAALNRLLVEQGLAVHAVGLTRTDLETVFLDLVEAA